MKAIKPGCEGRHFKCLSNQIELNYHRVSTTLANHHFLRPAACSENVTVSKDALVSSQLTSEKDKPELFLEGEERWLVSEA